MHRKSTIPSQAKLVFKGQIFDVYQWEQEMFDGTKEIFEKLKRQDTAMVIAITQDKQIIVQEEEQPGSGAFVSLPGGRIEDDEDPLVGARRELLEETGYESQDVELYGSDAPFGKIDWVVYHFIAKNCVYKSAPTLDAGEKIKLRFVDFEEFVKIVDSESFRDVGIKNTLNKLRLTPSEFLKFQKVLGL